MYLGKTIELTDAEYEQIMKCRNYKYKTTSGDLVKGLDSTVINDAKVCKASDPGLKLTFDAQEGREGAWVVKNDEQLQRVCACSTIDYLWIGGAPNSPGQLGCPTCKQKTLDTCQLKSISYYEMWQGYSLSIYGPIPEFKNLQGLSKLSGTLPGGLIVKGTGLTSLDGLNNITNIDDADGDRDIYIQVLNNSNLISTMALNNTRDQSGNIFTSDTLSIGNNPQLACVPEQWPAKDSDGETIRNGKALHDPCQYQCDSAAHTCSQTATGTQSESACASSCTSHTLY